MSALIQPVDAPAVGQRTFRYYDVIATLFVAVYLISQVASAKLFSFSIFQFPGAAIIFPFSYIFGDILTECYGYARTRRIIWLGFISAVLMALTFLVVQKLPPAPGWNNQEAYEKILGVVPRVVLGSIAAYWAGEFINSFVMAKLKVMTAGKYLWTRTIGSTVVGQAVDTIVFVVIAFSGLAGIPVLLRLSVSLYLFKVIYETLATPLTYLLVGWLKRAEGIDVYDRGTNFSPFKF